MTNSAAGPDTGPPTGSGAGNPPGTATLPGMIRTYRDHWEIRMDGNRGYLAVERAAPITIEPPAPRVITAASLDELRQQLQGLAP